MRLAEFRGQPTLHEFEKSASPPKYLIDVWHTLVHPISDDVDPTGFVLGVTLEPEGGSASPTLPILVVSILMVRPTTAMMFVPSLSQHLLLVSLIKNEPVKWLYVVVSVSGTLAAGALLTAICARLYRREGLLGCRFSLRGEYQRYQSQGD